MSNTTLIDVFSTSLNIESNLVVDTLAYSEHPNWDSTAHMILITDLESAFDVMLEPDDIIDMSSVAKARRILAKHGVAF
ncbi:acyl carrier protein [Alteromonas sp. 5E99-2]|uniref:acyl carrier protein n=1 Tax=Alteromonas sp. 5E99-2 TaxID=2817683 RepID=UPI001A9805BD|nr:acyl carrier protein [Alteromonas sp. 5E99-2]MBO1255237.1 acyl carrier protein [Alteromonas sp. 5E99-2]